MISLAATDLDARSKFKTSNVGNVVDRGSIPATLIIIPPPRKSSPKYRPIYTLYRDELTNFSNWNVGGTAD